MRLTDYTYKNGLDNNQTPNNIHIGLSCLIKEMGQGSPLPGLNGDVDAHGIT
jgi:hypothetical protein